MYKRQPVSEPIWVAKPVIFSATPAVFARVTAELLPKAPLVFATEATPAASVPVAVSYTHLTLAPMMELIVVVPLPAPMAVTVPALLMLPVENVRVPVVALLLIVRLFVPVTPPLKLVEMAVPVLPTVKVPVVPVARIIGFA